MSMRRLKSLRDRRGFALILVFSLASLVLLLGLSLVSLTQVESASSRYDQGMRVARANARLALQMAVGDLQELSGPDQRITALADGGRLDAGNPADTNFNDATDPASNGVYQPFWTGVWDNDNTTNDPVWLVTRPLDATYTLNSGTQNADPFASDLGATNGTVKLVGEGSAKPENPGVGQQYFDVYVPREPVSSTDVVGLTSSEQAAIGHYAYWVGDNGSKASYLLSNDLPDVLHDGYESGGNPTDANTRLKRMAAHRSYLEVDGRLMNATNARLKAIASEFALRESLGDGSSLIGNLTHNDIVRRFHDTSSLSLGLLVDTVRGGLREDLSIIHEVDTDGEGDGTDEPEEILVNHHLMPYLNVDSLARTSPTELTRSYSIRAKNVTNPASPVPTVAPLITEFNFRLWLSTPDFAAAPAQQSNLHASFGASVELWNPYSSALAGEQLVVRILNLDEATGITVKYHAHSQAVVEHAGVALLTLLNNQSDFLVRAPAVGESWWAPGEAKTFTGSYNNVSVQSILNPGVSYPVGLDYVYSVPQGQLPRMNSPLYEDGPDYVSLEGPVWNPVVALLTAAGDELYRFQLSGVSYNELKSSPTVADDVAQPHLSYKWELRDPDVFWTNYDPRTGIIDLTQVMDLFEHTTDPPPGYDPFSMEFYEYPGSNFSFNNSLIQTSAVDLLASNADGEPENNITMFELPRQEFLSLAGLQMAEFPSGVRHHLGISNATSPVASINDVFDRFFLSTVPQGTTTWTVANPLPNARMRPLSNATIADLQDEESAEHLFLEGAFNINSTSIEAWESLLKGIRLGDWIYDDPDGANPVAGQETLDVSGETQLFRFSQSAEETWVGTYDFAEPLDVERQHFRKGMRSLSDAEIELIAESLVGEIRERRQSTTGEVGPFVSLQDFIDSGAIENAILAANLNQGITEPYWTDYLSQQDVLSAIGPYLSARSDTFVVRAYGDAVNPFDSSEIVARAYCEAIVQRTHEKHDTDPNNTSVMATTGLGAGEYGRKYKIVAFRWMTGDEI